VPNSCSKEVLFYKTLLLEAPLLTSSPPLFLCPYFFSCKQEVILKGGFEVGDEIMAGTTFECIYTINMYAIYPAPEGERFSRVKAYSCNLPAEGIPHEEAGLAGFMLPENVKFCDEYPDGSKNVYYDWMVRARDTDYDAVWTDWYVLSALIIKPLERLHNLGFNALTLFI